MSLVVLLNACKHSKHTEKAEQPDSINYKLDTVRYKALHEELLLNGVVAFDEGLVDRVFPLVSGTVESVDVSLGDYVKKGQSLATVISSDISDYINDYKRDKNAYDIAKRKVETSEELYKAKFLSETELITARKDFETASDQLKRSAEILKIYGAENKDKPYFSVVSPITGYVVEKNINQGMELRSDHSEPIFVVSSLNKVWVLANVYESDIAQVRQGQEVLINTIVYPEKDFKGTISKVGNLLDADSKVLKVRIELDNSDGLLKPDMFTTIHLHLSPSEKFLAVPSKAVVFDKDKYFVIVKTAKGFVVREVKMIKDTSAFSFIGGEIKEGDQVVTEGSLLLYNEING
jgi:cobalt-zinc-cadmium efflux system membrane fusion protein